MHTHKFYLRPGGGFFAPFSLSVNLIPTPFGRLTAIYIHPPFQSNPKHRGRLTP